MSGPRVYDGEKFIPVDASAVAGNPPAPVEGGNGQIFVAIPSYRGKNLLLACFLSWF